MIELKTFEPIMKKEYFCWNCCSISTPTEGADEVWKRANKWIEENNIKVINIERKEWETEDYLFKNAFVTVYYEK